MATTPPSPAAAAPSSAGRAPDPPTDHVPDPPDPPDPGPDPLPVPAGRARVLGLDLARFLAVAGMVLAHTWPSAVHAGPEPLWLSGKPAALFAVLAGVGVAISARSARDPGGTGAARRALAARGAVLLVLGLTLAQPGTAVAVILAFYGVLFWLVLPLLTVRDGTLVALAVATGAVAPVLAHLAHRQWPSPVAMASPAWSDVAAPGRLVLDLLLTGAYPALVWLPYLLIGTVVGRAVLRVRSDAVALRRLAARLVAVGSACAVLGAGVPALVLHLRFGTAQPEAVPGLWALVPSVPHTGTTGDLALTTGTALLATGLCLLVGGVLRGPARRAAAPVLAAGAAPLTIYVLHVVVTTVLLVVSVVVAGDGGPSGAAEDPVPARWAQGPAACALQLVLVLAVGALLARTARRGPLERLVAAVAARAAGRR